MICIKTNLISIHHQLSIKSTVNDVTNLPGDNPGHKLDNWHMQMMISHRSVSPMFEEMCLILVLTMVNKTLLSVLCAPVTRHSLVSCVHLSQDTV